MRDKAYHSWSRILFLWPWPFATGRVRWCNLATLVSEAKERKVYMYFMIMSFRTYNLCLSLLLRQIHLILLYFNWCVLNFAYLYYAKRNLEKLLILIGKRKVSLTPTCIMFKSWNYYMYLWRHQDTSSVVHFSDLLNVGNPQPTSPRKTMIHISITFKRLCAPASGIREAIFEILICRKHV